VKETDCFKREWRPDDIRDMWDFAQHDFERFLKLLMWMDDLD